MAYEETLRDLEFTEWKSKVSGWVESYAGLSADDLPDCPYMDWFEEGVTPQRAARRAIKSAME